MIRRGVRLCEISRIEFLECSVYTFEAERGECTCGMLVEDMLEHDEHTKWNGNNGYVHGADASNGMSILVQGMASLDLQGSTAGSDLPSSNSGTSSSRSVHLQVKVEHYPQAFSHYTYWKSNRKLLVCDLQGVQVASTGPSSQPVFRLTDPVIHYHNSRSSRRKSVYGRTDHGKKGFTSFFKTHKCNAICSLLGLPASTTKKR